MTSPTGPAIDHWTEAALHPSGYLALDHARMLREEATARRLARQVGATGAERAARARIAVALHRAADRIAPTPVVAPG